MKTIILFIFLFAFVSYYIIELKPVSINNNIIILDKNPVPIIPSSVGSKRPTYQMVKKLTLTQQQHFTKTVSTTKTIKPVLYPNKIQSISLGNDINIHTRNEIKNPIQVPRKVSL